MEGFDERRKVPKKKMTRVNKKKKRRNRMLTFFIIVCAIVAFFYFLFNTKLLALKEIEVEGNKLLSKEVIIKTADLTLGENILKLPLEEASYRLKNDSYVKNVNIVRAGAHKIIIRIEERKVVCQYQSGNDYYLIDEDGFILDKKNTALEDTPIILNWPKISFKNKDNFYDNVTGEKLKELIAAISENELVNYIKLISKEADDEVNITFRDNMAVQLGRLEDVSYKIRVLKTLMTKFSESGQKCKMIMFNKGKKPIVILDR